ncbi:cytochrome c heme lyase subunit ccmL [Vibrio ishigakensis]|uniref:Cytochrome c-type biogenesis protein n=1 Tax=Vibrio ishigakensis TaxID=1481914 RepID=A0A0B8P695_9VIBR|nr:cytochrome c-type biogenesis protein [Vibrio ishigakensis]GAM58434.1 cytochrome c heme lyase subunit ccmL [Vibrio ishigakensis]
MKSLLTLVVLLLVSSFSLAESYKVHPVELFEFDSIAQQKQAINLAKTLRCPMCQNQNLIESNSEVAKDIRLRVFELVKAGKSDAEVKAFMVERYGEHVLYKPKLSMQNTLLWGVPILLGLFMIGFSIGQIKRKLRYKP